MQKIILLGLLFCTTLVTAKDEYHPLLASSLNRVNKNLYDSETEVVKVSDWLAELPSVTISTLQSNKTSGSDDYELSINLPFKSPERKKLDNELSLLTKLYLEHANEEKILFVSGLIRESVWNYKIAAKEKEIEQEKLNWLKKQRALLKTMDQAGGAKLDLLLVEHQLNESQVRVIEFNREAETRLKQFQNITSAQQVSKEFYEPAVAHTLHQEVNHPGFKQIQIGMDLADIQLKLAGKSSSPINVSLNAVTTEMIGVNDQQYGIAFEIPIGKKNHTTQAEASAWQQELSSLMQQMMAFREGYLTTMNSLIGEHQSLLEKQPLLIKQAEKTKLIFNHLEELRRNNELDRSMFYQRMVNLIGSIHQAELNQLLINQNQSRQQQLAGVSL